MKSDINTPISKLPKWQRVVFYLMLIGGSIHLIDYGKDFILGSPRSRTIKATIKPLADQLERAQKVGDKQAVIALLDPTLKILNEYNELDAAKRTEINNTPLRYCVLASFNLADGISEVINTGSWVTKDKYQNALDMCK